MGRPSGHVNQCLANLVIDEQLPIWNENNLYKYKKMYPILKAWVLLELRESLMPQQLTLSIEEKINPIDNGRQQTMTPKPAQIGSIPLICQESIIPHPANTLGSTPLIRQPTIHEFEFESSVSQQLTLSIKPTVPYMPQGLTPTT